MPLAVNKMTKDQLRQHVLMLAMELTQLGKEIKNLKEIKRMYQEGDEAELLYYLSNLMYELEDL